MPWTNASIVLNSRDRTSGQYNNSQFNSRNQNIIQGQIHSISVNEVNFPYDIPNIQAGFNTFELASADTSDVLTITIIPGFYTGTELETAINAEIAIQAAASSPVVPVGDYPVVTYAPTDNLFYFTSPTNPPPGNPTPTWHIYSAYTFPAGYDQATNTLGKDILSIMGFLPSQSNANVVSSDPAQNAQAFEAAQSAPLSFTQYVDICSPQLCKGQRFRDGSTTNLARRSDVICRLYISNNVATQEEEGARPFVINRQFNNARVMKWTTDNSVGTIDIQLYDDVGQPLTTTWQPRPFQITFNCYEKDTDGDDSMLTEKLKALIGGAASYL